MIEWCTSIVATQGVAAHWSNDGMIDSTASPAEDEVGAAKVPLNCNLEYVDESIWTGWGKTRHMFAPVF